MVSFTVINANLVFEHLEQDALSNWLKPFNLEYFNSIIRKATAFLKYEELKSKGFWNVMFVRSEYRLIKINLSNIEYIESVGNYLRIYLIDEKPIMTLMTFKTMLEKLPKERFIRIHRRYMIAIDKIQSVGNRKVQLHSIELPVGNSFITDLNVLVKQ